MAVTYVAFDSHVKIIKDEVSSWLRSYSPSESLGHGTRVKVVFKDQLLNCQAVGSLTLTIPVSG